MFFCVLLFASQRNDIQTQRQTLAGTTTFLLYITTCLWQINRFPKENIMPIICLTGGLAAGKSTAAQYFAEQGAEIIDADKLGHETYEAGSPANDQIVAAFGPEVRAEDGSIDRKALGSKVFGQPNALKQLTDIVWPEIRTLAEARCQAVSNQDPKAIVVLEAAVLFEAGWEDIGDEVWVVTAEPEIVIDRAINRDGLTREAIEARLKSQLSNTERRTKADFVIENNADQETFKTNLAAAWARIQG